MDTNKIPAGLSCAEGSNVAPEQYAAIKHVHKIGNYLACEYSDLLYELTKDTSKSYRDIAEIIVPDLALDHPSVVEKAVGYAIRQIVPPDELKILTHERRSLRKLETIKSMGKVAYSEEQREKANKSWENRDKPDVDAMLRGRGRIAWSDDEKDMLLELIKNSSFQHNGGGSRDKTPNYELIASELNSIFHDNNPVRYPNSVGSMKRDFFRKKKD